MTASTTARRTRQSAASDVRHGDVLDNVTRFLYVDDVQPHGDRVSITYRYTDDEGVLRLASRDVAADTLLRVRNDMPLASVEPILTAPVAVAS